MHVKRDDNVVADALSRINAISMPMLIDPVAIEEAQKQDDCSEQIGTDTSLKLQKLKLNNVSILCDVSNGRVRQYIPVALLRKVFDSIHGLSHPSGRMTSRHLSEQYVWPGMKKDVAQWVRQCIPCQRSKIHRHTQLIPQRIDVPDHRFDHIHLDLIILRPVDQYRYCLTIIDRFSRWPMAIPLKDQEAKTVATAMYSNWICQYGTPLTITTDQSSQFESALFRSLAKVVGAKGIHTTRYHSKANGIIERMHRTLKAALICQAPTPWPEALPTVLLGLRTYLKEDINASPAEMLYGAPLRVPGAFIYESDEPASPQLFLDR